MLKKITLNNMMLENQRKSPLYQAIIVDLCNAGAIDADIAAGLLGEDVPDYLKLPRHFHDFVDDDFEDEDAKNELNLANKLNAVVNKDKE